MITSTLKRLFVSVYIIFAFVAAGLIGFMVFKGANEGGTAQATRTLLVYPGATGIDNYTSIQAAVNAASSGDTIRVWAGTYNENVIVNKKLNLTGNGTTNTTIDGGGTGDVLRITSEWVNITGFKLTNSGNQIDPNYDAGIELDGVENVTVFQNNCSDNNYGICIKNSNSNKIINNSCFSNSHDGILIYLSNNNDIANNSCNFNYYSGIYLPRSNFNTIKNNTCNYNGYAIWLFFSNSNIILENTCNSNGVDGIYVQDSNSNTIDNNDCFFNYQFGIVIYSYYSISKMNKIANNSINSASYGGILFMSCESSIVSRNTLSSCGLYIIGTRLEYWNTHNIDTTNQVNGEPLIYWKNKKGGVITSNIGQVILTNCSNVHIEGLNIHNMQIPIILGFSNSNTIINNNLSQNLHSVQLYSSNYNTLANNYCNSNIKYGLWAVLSDWNIFENNTQNLNELNGLHFYSSNNNTINRSSISHNIVHGISLNNSKGNVFVFNNISENLNNGICLNYSSDKNTISNNHILNNKNTGINILDSNNNKIYFNNFINNSAQALEIGDSSNLWDNGNFEGNYWSDYTGLDNGANGRIPRDGIGDTKLKHSGLDNYPFMNRSGWLFPGIPILIDPGDYDSDGNYTVSWEANRGTTGYVLEEDYYHSTMIYTAKVIYKGSGLSYQLNNKPNGTYYYRLKAYNDAYESVWSKTVEIDVDWPPNIPQNFKAAPYPYGNTLNLSWDLDSVDVKEYLIEYKNNTISDWEVLKTVKHPGYSFNHTNLQDGEIYHYRIQAKDNRNQVSGFVDVVGIPRDTVAPAVPSGLYVADTSYDWIKLVWEPNTELDIKGYYIYIDNLSKPTDPWDLIGIRDATKLSQEEFIVKGLAEHTTFHFVIKAFDEVPNNSSYSKSVFGTTTLGPHAPEVNSSYLTSLIKYNRDTDTYEIPEDTYDTSINLYKLFLDINVEDVLKFRFEGNHNISVKIDEQTGEVNLTPVQNWNGEEALTFYANDSVFETFYTLIINVTFVNDRPEQLRIISPIDNFKIKEGGSIAFEGDCDDLDLIYGDKLTFTWLSDISGEIGEDNSFNKILPHGKHKITLIVSDEHGGSINDSIIVTVEKKEEDDMNALLIPSIVGFIIVLVLIIILVLVLRKKKDSEKEMEAEKAQEAPPYITPTTPEHPPSEQPYYTPETQPEIVVPTDMQVQVSPQATQVEAPISAPACIEPVYYPELPYGTMETAPVIIEPAESLEVGKAYIIITKEIAFGLDIFEKLLNRTLGKGISITRLHPSQLPSNPIMDGVNKIWLSKTPEENSISPGNITKIAHVISEFLKNNEKGAILLDGLEYLINNNDFPKILKFIQSIHEVIVLNKGILLLPINPLTLSKTDFEILQDELTNTIRDPTYSDE